MVIALNLDENFLEFSVKSTVVGWQFVMYWMFV